MKNSFSVGPPFNYKTIMFLFGYYFLATIIVTVRCTSVVHSTFTLHEKTTQINTNIHTIIAMAPSDVTDTECANYCLMQGSQFR